MTSQVLLRDVRENDLPVFFEHQLDPVATQMAAFPARDREPFMAHWAKILGDNTVIKQTILFNGGVAGNIVCWEQSGDREVGYWIGREFWGKGIATWAFSEFLHQVKTRPSTPMLPNTISLLSGCWKNVGSRFCVKTRTSCSVRQPKNLL